MILQALNRYYERMTARGEAEEPGWSKEKIGWAIELSANGKPLAVLRLEDPLSKKSRPQLLSVPAPAKRTSGISPGTLWDKTSYVLGCTAKTSRRTSLEHSAFKEATLTLIGENKDEGLKALRDFLAQWTPAQFTAPIFPEEMLDGNVVFRLTGRKHYIHESEAARALIGKTARSSEDKTDFCLVTGQLTAPRRLHPTIKGVAGAQSSGASLVSFNLPSFCSYGRAQGANAPVSDIAAEHYGAALNALLARGGRNRLSRGMGDATVVFWADTSDVTDESAAVAAEDMFSFFSEGTEGDKSEAGSSPDDDMAEAARLRDSLIAIAEGRPQFADPNLKPGVSMHVLGLAPNAARLSVRFWLSDSLEHFAGATLRHIQDLELKPLPRFWLGRKGPPGIWRLLIKTTAVQEKFENVPPLLGGELARAVLTGAQYPRLWLSTAVMRLRAGDPPDTGWHAAAIKACINRNPEEEDLPVALDPDNHNTAYQLGRLFALLEIAQREALGNINASIVDRYYSAASSTPARVFPTLLRSARVYLSDVKKRGKGFWIEKRLDSIMGKLGPEFPLSLRLVDQGRFAVGYYHERSYRGEARSHELDTTELSDNNTISANS